ncbi:hypothetical protein GKJPGBOP_03678 [Streptomyces paromomycinus]|uniref:Transmembrane protein n=1 Tax=Streptomyces paromomycinus TaxID=92743 RepID=A0A401W3V6_STREY|nr:hypothetical protein GKJPGBOP_03678 [Streptomyces paromomycinus]
MARDYDSQLLESVAVRRRRMRDALLFGAQRGRRTLDERLGKIFAGVVVAAVLCAGCVAWSFLQHTLAQQKAEQEEQQHRTRQYGQPPKSAKSVESRNPAEQVRAGFAAFRIPTQRTSPAAENFLRSSTSGDRENRQVRPAREFAGAPMVGSGTW